MHNIVPAQNWDMPVVDPGFPIGGTDLVGGTNSQGSYVSKNLYVKTKESGPVGGGGAGGAPWIRHCVRTSSSEGVMEAVRRVIKTFLLLVTFDALSFPTSGRKVNNWSESTIRYFAAKFSIVYMKANILIQFSFLTF